MRFETLAPAAFIFASTFAAPLESNPSLVTEVKIIASETGKIALETVEPKKADPKCIQTVLGQKDETCADVAMIYGIPLSDTEAKSFVLSDDCSNALKGYRICVKPANHFIQSSLASQSATSALQQKGTPEKTSESKEPNHAESTSASEKAKHSGSSSVTEHPKHANSTATANVHAVTTPVTVIEAFTKTMTFTLNSESSVRLRTLIDHSTVTRMETLMTTMPTHKANATGISHPHSGHANKTASALHNSKAAHSSILFASHTRGNETGATPVPQHTAGRNATGHAKPSITLIMSVIENGTMTSSTIITETAAPFPNVTALHASLISNSTSTGHANLTSAVTSAVASSLMPTLTPTPTSAQDVPAVTSSASADVAGAANVTLSATPSEITGAIRATPQTQTQTSRVGRLSKDSAAMAATVSMIVTLAFTYSMILL